MLRSISSGGKCNLPRDCIQMPVKELWGAGDLVVLVLCCPVSLRSAHHYRMRVRRRKGSGLPGCGEIGWFCRHLVVVPSLQPGL